MDLRSLEQLYIPMPSAVREQFRHLKSVTFEMKPTGPPVVNGANATVTCVRTQRVVTREGQRFSVENERVRVTLSRVGPRWVYGAGTACLGAAFFFASHLASLWQFYVFIGALVGIGVSLNGMVPASGQVL